jgi:hypothetical protein
MNIKYCFFVLWAAILLCSPIASTAQQGTEPLSLPVLSDNFLAPWSIYGSNTLKTEYYDVKGNKASSPYGFEGLEYYNEITLNLSRNITAYNQWQARISGVMNHSNYRSNNFGFIPERIYLMNERGDVDIPFRFEAGDVYSYLSYRTLQRSIKGLQIELQPDFGDDEDRLHSISIISGTTQSSWTKLHVNEDYTNGLSWLIDDLSFGRWSLNWINNFRDNDINTGTIDRTQNVFSLAGEKRIRLGSEQITMEGEVGQFSGDHDGLNGVASGQNKNDTALFLQLRGISQTPISYRFRFEANGQDYRPNGSIVTPDRISYEGFLGWLFAGGIQARGRTQLFRSNWKTGNPTDTVTYGLNLSGPVLPLIFNRLSMNVDSFIQRVEDENKSTDQAINAFSINLNKRISENWNGRLSFNRHHTDNQLLGTADTTSRQAGFAIDRSIQFLGFKGSFGPGIAVSRTHGSNVNSTFITPTLAVYLNSDGHSLGYNMSYLRQDHRNPGSEDLENQDHNLNYRYTSGSNTFGLQFTTNHRDPDQTESTESYKLAFSWTYAFGRPARLPGSPGVNITDTTPVPKALDETSTAIPALWQFHPGISVSSVKNRMKSAKALIAETLPGIVVYETRLLKSIYERQRVGLIHDSGKLTKSALIVEIENPGSSESIMQSYEQVQKVLLDNLGKPAQFFERGDVSASLATDIRNGHFIRLIEWDINGAVLRMGIPRRLDNKILIEVQFASSFPVKSDPFWSIEELRL